MIVLEPFTAVDFAQLQTWIDNEQLLYEWSGALFSFPLTDRALRWYIRDTNVIGESDAFIYKAVDTATGETVGHLSLGNISQRDQSARLTRVLVGGTQRGQGIGQQMIQQVLRIGFEDLGLHRISLGVYTFNHAAINCYLRVGFQQEGVLREIVKYNDEYWSSIEMGILEREWRARAEAATKPSS
jgi:RimJ/RimL family protein N-acetyltransferase